MANPENADGIRNADVSELARENDEESTDIVEEDTASAQIAQDDDTVDDQGKSLFALKLSGQDFQLEDVIVEIDHVTFWNIAVLLSFAVDAFPSNANH